MCKMFADDTKRMVSSLALICDKSKPVDSLRTHVCTVLGSDICSAWNPVCLGTILGVIGKIQILPGKSGNDKVNCGYKYCNNKD